MTLCYIKSHDTTPGMRVGKFDFLLHYCHNSLMWKAYRSCEETAAL